jgi:biotin transport system substrate-specific component
MSLGELALGRQQPRSLADLLPRAWVLDVVLVIGGAGLVGALAQISIPLSFTPVPITGQTLGVLLAGCALGWRRAAGAMGLYLLLGLAGLPWFVHHTAGWQGPSTGYLFGFILCGGICGWLAERGGDRRILRAIPVMLVGEVCIYAVGVPWLAIDLHVSLAKALSLGFTPFVGGDGIKAAIGAAALPGAWRLAGR